MTKTRHPRALSWSDFKRTAYGQSRRECREEYEHYKRTGEVTLWPKHRAPV